MTQRFRHGARRGLFAGPLMALLALQLAAPAQAALPPEYQRIREFEAVLASHEIVDRLKYEPIEAVEYVRTDLYRVTAGACSVEVRIVSDPAPEEEGWVGPRPFHVEVGEAVCE